MIGSPCGASLRARTPYLDNEIVALAFRAPVSSRQLTRSALRLVNDNKPDLGSIPTDRGLMCGNRDPLHIIRRLFAEVTFKLDYLHKEGLPRWLSPLDPLIGSLSKIGVLGLHKFLPYRRWHRRGLSSYIGDVLTDVHTQRCPYWNSRFLASIIADHVRGQKNYRPGQ
jgi:asparagine synthase (glutamine-hydrolysing)